MKFRTGGKPNGKMFEVELDDADMERDMGWADMSTADRWKAITNRGDTLAIEYMLRRGDISQEFAASRLREIRGESQ